MPTQSRGFFSCDYCGLACDTLDEATEHESGHCLKRPQQQQRPPASAVPPHHYPGYPPSYGTMGPLSTAETEPPPPGYPEYPHYAPKARCMPLMGPYDQGNLTPEDSIACQNIELFEAAPEHLGDHDSKGGAPVVVKQVGLRCVFCSKSPLSAAGYAVVFPGSLGSLGSSVRMVADNHLSSCSMAPPEVRDLCGKAASKRSRETGEEEGRNVDDEDERNRMALLEYCIGFCQHLGIVNKQPRKTGIEFADNGEPSHNPPYGRPTTVAETPAGPRGPLPPPYSGDRMGPPMGFPMRPGPPMMGGHMGPGDAIAPTPLQRRRDRQEEVSEPPPSAYSEREAPSTGYPTPYSQGPGVEGYGDVQTPAQPNFEGQEGGPYPTPHSAYSHSEGSPPGYQQYDLPSNFPFYQESNRTWHCKYCSHVHPQYRDPQSVWSAPGGGPPPGNFIDQHLGMCRAYHQSMPSPPMYQGPSPPYGPPYMQYPPYGPPGHWDSHSPTHGGMHPQHLQYPPGLHGEPPYPYPPHHPEHPPRYPGAEDPNYGDQRGRPGPPMGAHGMPPPPGVPPHRPSPQAPRAGAPVLPQRKESADAMVHAINHLVARENEQYSRDPRAVKKDRLVLEEDRLLLTDYFFFLMKQLRLCRFSEADRKTRGGKREKIKLGYGGLQCIHCADVPNSRKFFWSNVDRLANSFAEIPGHILKCRRCSQQTKDALLQLKAFHPEQMARLPRGSQKVFFRRMWRRLHPETAATDGSNAENVTPTKTDSPEAKSSVITKEQETSPPGTHASEESVVVIQRSTEEAATALEAAAEQANAAEQSGPSSPSSKIMLAIPEDKEWLSDMDCFIRKQLEVFCATQEDVATARSDRKYPVHLGQVGIRCLHCSMSKTDSNAKGNAVSFPFAISGIYEAVREFQRLHLDTCDSLPATTKAKLSAFKGSSSLSSVLRKYYVLAAKALGLEDTREGIRSGAETVPLSSQAAFSFSEGGPRVVTEEMRQTGSGATAETKTSPKAPTPPSKSTGTPPKEEGKKRPEPSSAPEDLAPPAKVSKKPEEEVGGSVEV